MAKSAREFTIFYAWQSDTPASRNRYLIAKALDAACAELQSDATIPYTITVTSDTMGLPGLCDIPAAILAKIDAADAVLLDLTYIAKTEKGKQCPNPNVLFELGYAFRSIGPERLICVMNEDHGATDEILFDIGHRRHPVKYTTRDGTPKKKIIATLAENLKSALEPTVRLGPRSAGVDAAEQFNLETNAIRHHWDAGHSNRKGPIVFFLIRPTNFIERRWATADALESLLLQKRLAELNGRHHYPPSQRYTDRMPWGLYNGAYGQPDWAVTYSGQFWAAIDVAAHRDLDEKRKNVPMETLSDLMPVLPDEWIDLFAARVQITDAYRFATSWSTGLHAHEEVTFRATAEKIQNTTLVTNDLFTRSRPCSAPFAMKSGAMSAEVFKDKWLTACVDFMEEFFGMYELDGDYIHRDTHQAHIDYLLRMLTRSTGQGGLTRTY